MSSKKSKLWLKLFYSPYFFTIALRRRSGEANVPPTCFEVEYVIPATCRKWEADPILVDDRDKTYMFYEAVHHDKGRIEVVQVNEDCTVSEPVVILEDECHYSYPFVFRRNGTWYMIPESSASGEVRLYRAAEFPFRWEKTAILLRQASVDTTVFESEGQLYLLTYLLSNGTEQVQPQAYRLSLDGSSPLLEPVHWDVYDTLRCRGAGPVMETEEGLIRPAQENEEQSYGNGLLFYRVHPNVDTYTERCVGCLGKDQVKVRGVWMNGLHTFSRSERFEAIDIRCREFDLWKVPTTIWNKLRKI